MVTQLGCPVLRAGRGVGVGVGAGSRRGWGTQDTHEKKHKRTLKTSYTENESH